jgi:hypothetical protein
MLPKVNPIKETKIVSGLSKENYTSLAFSKWVKCATGSSMEEQLI